jgi:hypothetical protein
VNLPRLLKYQFELAIDLGPDFRFPKFEDISASAIGQGIVACALLFLAGFAVSTSSGSNRGCDALPERLTESFHNTTTPQHHNTTTSHFSHLEKLQYINSNHANVDHNIVC